MQLYILPGDSGIMGVKSKIKIDFKILHEINTNLFEAVKVTVLEKVKAVQIHFYL